MLKHEVNHSLQLFCTRSQEIFQNGSKKAPKKGTGTKIGAGIRSVVKGINIGTFVVKGLISAV